jgi:HK97 family phage major capsid protein/HK97 family phage prohead protease
MEKRKQVGKLSRAVQIERDGSGDAEVFRASISSEEPYGRWFGTEILDHSPGSVDLSRAGDGLPLLWGHDGQTRGTVIGRVENIRIDDKRLRGDLRFFSTEAAQEVRTIVSEGHREMSVGYSVERMKLIESGKDGKLDTYRVTKWTPMEASIVGVPADHTVGIGRDAKEAADAVVELPDPEPILEPQEKAVAAEPAQMSQGEIRMEQQQAPAADTSVADIIKLGEKYAQLGGDKVAQEYLRSGRQDLAEFQTMLLERIGTKGSETASDIGMSRAERNRFSVVRLVRALANPSDRAAREAAAFEFEASEAALKAQGRGLRGNAQATIPLDVLYHAQRDLIVATSTMGGYTVGTDMMGGSFIDVLRNNTYVVAAGATVLSGLNGAIAVPSKTTPTTSYWVAEGTAPSEGAIVFGQVTMAPKTVGAWVDFSRKLMLQSSIDVEAMVRNDLYASLGLEIDRSALNGAGTGSEPSGILASTSVGTSAIGAQGGAPTWASIVELETLVAVGNADRGRTAYFFNSKTRGKLKTVVKSTSAVAGFIWEPDNTVNGYKTYVTNQLPSNLTKGTTTGQSAAIFGNWSDLMIGQWGGLDLLVDPFTASNTGTVRVVALQDVDIAIRRTASFAVAKDYTA